MVYTFRDEKDMGNYKNNSYLTPTNWFNYGVYYFNPISSSEKCGDAFMSKCLNFYVVSEELHKEDLEKIVTIAEKLNAKITQVDTPVKFGEIAKLSIEDYTICYYVECVNNFHMNLIFKLFRYVSNVRGNLTTLNNITALMEHFPIHEALILGHYYPKAICSSRDIHNSSSGNHTNIFNFTTEKLFNSHFEKKGDLTRIKKINALNCLKNIRLERTKCKGCVSCRLPCTDSMFAHKLNKENKKEKDYLAFLVNASLRINSFDLLKKFVVSASGRLPYINQYESPMKITQNFNFEFITDDIILEKTFTSKVTGKK